MSELKSFPLTFPALTANTVLGLDENKKTKSVAIGTGEGELAAGDHVHGNLTNDGKIGSAPGLPLITTAGGAVAVGTFGTTPNEFATGDRSIVTPPAELTQANDGSIVTAQISNDPAPAEVSLLLHLDNSLIDSGANALSVSSVSTYPDFEPSESAAYGSARLRIKGDFNDCIAVEDSVGFAPGENGPFLLMTRVEFAADATLVPCPIVAKFLGGDTYVSFFLEFVPGTGFQFSWADIASDVFTDNIVLDFTPDEEKPYWVGVHYDGTDLSVFVVEDENTTNAIVTETVAVTLSPVNGPVIFGANLPDDLLNGYIDEALFVKGDPAPYVTIEDSSVGNGHTYDTLSGQILVSKKYDVGGAIKLSAVADYPTLYDEGKMRYRSDSEYSYVDVAMRTVEQAESLPVISWINIVKIEIGNTI
jgi:hypothetical protein